MNAVCECFIGNTITCGRLCFHYYIRYIANVLMYRIAYRFSLSAFLYPGGFFSCRCFLFRVILYVKYLQFKLIGILKFANMVIGMFRTV